MISLSVKKQKAKAKYRYISVRIKPELAEKVDEFAQATKRSRSDIINQLLTAMVDRVHVISEEET